MPLRSHNSLLQASICYLVWFLKSHQWSKPHSGANLTAFVVQDEVLFFSFFEGNLRRWSTARETAKRMGKQHKINRKSWQRQNTKEKSWWTINESQKYKDLELMFILFEINSKKEPITMVQIAQCPMQCQYYAIHYTCRCIISSSPDKKKCFPCIPLYFKMYFFTAILPKVLILPNSIATNHFPGCRLGVWLLFCTGNSSIFIKGPL